MFCSCSQKRVADRDWSEQQKELEDCVLPVYKSCLKGNPKSSSNSAGSLHKRLSDSDMVANYHNNTLDSKTKKTSAHIKDSKSCSDIKNSIGVKSSSIKGAALEPPNICPPQENGSPASLPCSGEGPEGSGTDVSGTPVTTGYTASMCAVLCSMMKAQLLKTYEEVVTRYGGHFDMATMKATEVSSH